MDAGSLEGDTIVSTIGSNIQQLNQYGEKLTDFIRFFMEASADKMLRRPFFRSNFSITELHE